MSRTPLTVLVYFLASWLLGWMMVLDGLSARFWGRVFQFGGWMGWEAVARAAGLSLWEMGWPLLCIGFGLLGSSFALQRRRRWGFNYGLVFALLALAYFYLGSILALACLALLLAPATRAHLQPADP